MAHTETVSKLKDVVIDEMATPSVKSDEDDCYYIFVRVYDPDVRLAMLLCYKPIDNRHTLILYRERSSGIVILCPVSCPQKLCPCMCMQ